MGSERTVVVTGGTGGLGLAVTRAFIAVGYRTICTWVVERERDRARDALGDEVELRQVDVSDPESVGGLAADLDAGGGVWALAHLVGGYHDGDPVESMDLEALDRQLTLNLRATAVTLRAFLPGMTERGGGRVVTVSSRAAVAPFGGGGAYAASKAGVIALVKAASDEVKGRGVTVNTVLPSVIDTPANRSAMPDADFSAWVAPDELASVILFLCSPEASAVTGAAIPVYGRV